MSPLRWLSFPLFLLSALALGAALLVAAAAPRPSGYELSLYADLPPIFFVLTFLASAAAIALLLLSATDLHASWLPHGLALILLSNLLQLSLPLYLGFPVHNRADALNHIGYVQDILNTQSITPLDFYPGMHFLQLAVQSIPGVSSGAALLIVNLFFTLLWSLGPLLLVLSLTGDRRAACIAVAFSGIFWLVYYHSAVLPSILSTFLIPLILALFIWRERSTPGVPRFATVAFLILSIFLLVSLHPASALITLSLLIVYKLSQVFYFTFSRPIPSHFVLPDAEKGWGIISILAVLSFAWYFSNYFFISKVGSALLWLYKEQTQPSALGEALGLLTTAGLYPVNALSVLINGFAAPILIVASTFLFVVIDLLHHLRRRLPIPPAHFYHLSVFLAACNLAAITFLISTAERHPVRLLRTLVILAVCYLAWWVWEAFFISPASPHWPALFSRRPSAWKVALFLVLCLALGLSQLNLYEHPRNGLPNARLTHPDLAGMGWFVRSRTPDLPIAANFPSFSDRFAAYFLGYEGRRQLPDWWQPEIWLPSNFYHPAWSCIAQISPGLPAYLVLTDDARIASQRFPASVRARAHTYDLSAWDRLSTDPTASQLYDNGPLQVWLTDPSLPCSVKNP